MPLSYDTTNFQQAFEFVAGAVSVTLPVILVGNAASRSWVSRINKRSKAASETGTETLSEVTSALSRLALNYASGNKDEKPFEVVALSNYYTDALRRANVSFWFSLVSASFGFGVIIFSFITYKNSDVWGTVVKAGSGGIIDAVSALFFVQSTSAQKSMADFFEKLRLDRLNTEARSLISEIENVERRDQLRAQLVLKYANIDKLLVG